MKLLILGGTTEASQLARLLAQEEGFTPTISLAGRTTNPAPQPIPTRTGGFGGIQGLTAYLTTNRIDALVDATHPFAAQMRRHAAEAAKTAGIPLLAILRPAWQPGPGDNWTTVPTMRDAATALGPIPRRVFLTIGAMHLAPFAAAPHHTYLIRSVDPPPPETLPPNTTLLTARGPFTEPGERALLRDQRIDILVTKNAGGAATQPKLAAARALNLPVVMIARPPQPAGLPTVPNAEAALAWLHQLALRGA